MSDLPDNRAARGFTLIELLIVTAILGLLAVFASHALVGFADGVIVDTAEPDVAAVWPELSQAAQLVQLAGLAILLFGAGFWYLSELSRPGRLDRFRLGHFLLLALTFSLFFAVFAVLDAREHGPATSAGVAAAISYPLVVMHVRTIVGWRFAVFAALPLAAFTTGIAVNGVYGGELRGLIFLGMLCVVVAFLTYSYPRLSRSVEAGRQHETHELARRTTALSGLAMDFRNDIVEATRLLQAPDTDERLGLRGWLENRLDEANRCLQDFDRLGHEHSRMLYVTSRSSQKLARSTAMQLATELDRKMPATQAALQKAMTSLANLRAATEQPSRKDEPGYHCTGCGHPADPSARYCGNCGRESAERRQCHRCAHVLHLPKHLLQPGENDITLETHCHCCGERHRVAG